MRKLKDSIEVSVATYKPRFKSFFTSFESVFNGNDSFTVNINGFDDECLEFAEKVETRFGGSNLSVICSDERMNYGDRAKFKPLKWFEDTGSYPDYFITIDDDIVYPTNYIERLVSTCKEYGGIPVGVHGISIFRKQSQITNYFSQRLVTHFAFSSKKKFVNCLGTGTLCFSPKVVPISFNFFELPNMTDCYFALFCQQNQIPMLCIDRPVGWLVEIVDNTPSLWSLRGDGKEQTKIINKCLEWRIFSKQTESK